MSRAGSAPPPLIRAVFDFEGVRTTRLPLLLLTMTTTFTSGQGGSSASGASSSFPLGFLCATPSISRTSRVPCIVIRVRNASPLDLRALGAVLASGPSR